MKTCSKCKEIKDSSSFGKNIARKDNLQRRCNVCRKKYRQQNKELISKTDNRYRANNKEKIQRCFKKWRLKNLDKMRAYGKKWADANKDKIAIKGQKYRKNNTLKCNLRARLNRAIKGAYKSGSAVRDLGCSILELKKHLEAKFQPGMGWDNYGKYGWHIDHIKPLAKFDLTNREQFLEVCHYSNLQPLWAKDNLSKGSSYAAK